MERKAFISINGATYEYAYKISGGEHDSQLQRLQQQIDRLVAGVDDTVHVLNVMIDGNPAELKVTPRDVWAAAAYLETEQSATPLPRGGRRSSGEPNLATVGF